MSLPESAGTKPSLKFVFEPENSPEVRNSNETWVVVSSGRPNGILGEQALHVTINFYSITGQSVDAKNILTPPMASEAVAEAS